MSNEDYTLPALFGIAIAGVGAYLLYTTVLAERVFGLVADSKTQQPISGAKVSLGNRDTGQIFSAITGADGRYSISLKTGRYMGAVTKAGYIPTVIFPFTVDRMQQVEKNFLMLTLLGGGSPLR